MRNPELQTPVHPGKLLLQSLLLAALVLHSVLAPTGCSPITQVKRSALTLSPAPPTSSGRAIGHKNVRLYGGMGPAEMGVETRAITEVGDAGLWVPEHQLLGGLKLGLGDHVDLGFKGLWSTFEWSHASTAGVAPLGRKEVDAWALGPTLTISLPLGKSGLALGFALETLWSTIPYASWQLRKTEESQEFQQYPYDPHAPWEAKYDLMEEGHEHFLLFNWAMMLNYRFDPTPIQLFAGAGLHSTLSNVGFDNERDYSSTLDKGTPVPLLMMGMEAMVAEHLTCLVEAYLPVNDGGESSHVFGPGVEFALGLQL